MTSSVDRRGIARPDLRAIDTVTLARMRVILGWNNHRADQGLDPASAPQPWRVRQVKALTPVASSSDSAQNRAEALMRIRPLVARSGAGLTFQAAYHHSPFEKIAEAAQRVIDHLPDIVGAPAQWAFDHLARPQVAAIDATANFMSSHSAVVGAVIASGPGVVALFHTWNDLRRQIEPSGKTLDGFADPGDALQRLLESHGATATSRSALAEIDRELLYRPEITATAQAAGIRSAREPRAMEWLAAKTSWSGPEVLEALDLPATAPVLREPGLDRRQPTTPSVGPSFGPALRL